MSKPEDQELSAISEGNRAFVVEWLRDRSAFHSWFSSLVTGSFVVITVFGRKPDLASPGGVPLATAEVVLPLALLCNLAGPGSMPSGKCRGGAGIATDARAMRREPAIAVRPGVIPFVSLGVVGNPARGVARPPLPAGAERGPAAFRMNRPPPGPPRDSAMSAQRRRFPMIRSFHLADWITVANASWGKAAP